MKSIVIGSTGIKQNLKTVKPLNAVCEYIWNGFDANATEVKVITHNNDLEMIDEIVIEDNGSGICYEELNIKFSAFNESRKKAGKNNHSIPHGNKGVGRLTFFSFARFAKWETVYKKNKEKYSYYIKMENNNINRYDDNNEKLPIKVSRNVHTGTRVTFEQVHSLSKEEIIETIKEEFFWFLELNKDKKYKIIVDGRNISYDDYIITRENICVKDQGIDHEFDIRFVHWNKSLKNEYSRFYYINSKNNEMYKEATKLNKKSDEFYHSIFIKSNYFDDFLFEDEEIDGQISFGKNKSDDEYKRIICLITDYLVKYRKKYLIDSSNRYIDRLIDKGLYPVFEDDFLGTYRKNELNNLVGTLYAAKPKIFTGLSDDNKKITLHLLNLIMENQNKEELFNVLKNLIELDDYELQELSNVLKYTSLSNITKVIKILEDRIRVIDGLSTMVFDLKNYTLEVPHLQEVVENHYWLFGEEYSLITAAEPNFEQALRGLIFKTTGQTESVTINHEDKNKEMDIFMIRQDMKGKVTENVVVELKRPNISLGEVQVSQVKQYMRVIKSDDRFNSNQVKWTYFLVGNKFNNNGYIQGELDSHKHLGENGLIHSESNGMHKIFVKTWSDIFDDFHRRHNYLMEKLAMRKEKLEQENNNPQDIVNRIKQNEATMPSAVV